MEPGSKPDIYINGVRSALPEWYSHLGIGVFSTMLITKTAGRFDVRGLSQQIERLYSNAAELKLIAPGESELRKIIVQAASEFKWRGIRPAILRILVLPDTTYVVTIEDFVPRFSLKYGITLLPVQIERPIPHIKSCSAIASVYAAAKAREVNIDEALLIDRNGTIREGAWSNFFWIDKSNIIHTAKDRILNGVTRKLVLEIARALNMEVLEHDFNLQKVAKGAAEIFITQSTHGLIPVSCLYNSLKLSELPGINSKMLMQGYENIGYEQV